jgi:hypothetical protein
MLLSIVLKHTSDAVERLAQLSTYRDSTYASISRDKCYGSHKSWVPFLGCHVSGVVITCHVPVQVSQEDCCFQCDLSWQ